MMHMMMLLAALRIIYGYHIIKLFGYQMIKLLKLQCGTGTVVGWLSLVTLTVQGHLETQDNTSIFLSSFTDKQTLF